MYTVHCIVDDNSSNPVLFQAEHGVAFLIESPAGKVLFDTGQSGTALVNNAANLDIDLHQVDALVLSHAHYDHTGGLEEFLRKSKPGLPLYAHPDLFRQRYAIKDGQTRSIGLRMTKDDLAKHTKLNLNIEPRQILPGVWTTGEITLRTEFEGRSPHHYIQADKGWQPDPYRDDFALVMEAQSGLVIVCGCCHAGLLNTLAHVRRIFNKEIEAVVGGAHLADVEAKALEHAINYLRATSLKDVPYLYLNHCTGERALATLAQAFGKKASPCPAGTVLMFE